MRVSVGLSSPSATPNTAASSFPLDIVQHSGQRPLGGACCTIDKDELNMGVESASQAALCGIEISKRPPKTFTQKLLGLISLVVFLVGCISVNATQLLFVVPLALLPFPWAKEAHESSVRYTKGAFGILISELSGRCSPRKLTIP